jgi:hypothetical protein
LKKGRFLTNLNYDYLSDLSEYKIFIGEYIIDLMKKPQTLDKIRAAKLF